VPTVVNHLIEMLPRRDRSRLLSICEPVELGVAEVLADTNSLQRFVYFPTGSVVSITTPSEKTPVLEVGMVGAEGMLGIQLALGFQSALHASVLGAGSAWRVAATPFRREVLRSTSLQQGLNGYLLASMLQLASFARCVQFHPVDRRLARWLLMTHDRIGAHTFCATQEMMAHRLGIRRVGITLAAVALQRRGVIDYARGQLTIIDRAALEKSACSCYADEVETYAKLLRGISNPRQT
jgi:CRP-like cAMP-binding protein